mmetsp:Transcript_20286/g.32713  ORF Transcript_20286/g.32713 Transcript_20286/m.32713 type:complete len:88 (+) Transcript_20286:1653-1916(+)
MPTYEAGAAGPNVATAATRTANSKRTGFAAHWRDTGFCTTPGTIDASLRHCHARAASLQFVTILTSLEFCFLVFFQFSSKTDPIAAY